MDLSDSEYKQIDGCLDDIHNARVNFLWIRDETLKKKMIVLGLAKIVIEYHGEVAPITFTERGQEVLSAGKGYKAYCENESLKLEREKEMYQFTKESIGISKRAVGWAKAAFWASLLIGLCGIVISIMISKGYIHP